MIRLMHGRTPVGESTPTARTALSGDFPAVTAVVVDGDTVDLVAVGRSLDGDRIPLQGAEARFAVAYGTTRLGMSAAVLAGLLGVEQRTIVRYRIEMGVASDAQ